MKKKVLLLVVATLFLLVACSNEEQHYEELGAAGNFYDKISVDLDELTAIRAEYTSKGNGYSLTMPQETKGFQMLSHYLDCEVEKLRVPMEAYELDPLSLVFQKGDKEVEAFFITAQNEDGEGKTTYLVKDGEVYRLLFPDWSKLWLDLFPEDSADAPLYWGGTNYPLINTFIHRLQKAWSGPTNRIIVDDEGYTHVYQGEENVRVNIGGASFDGALSSYEALINNSGAVCIGNIETIKMGRARISDYMGDASLLYVKVQEVLSGTLSSEELRPTLVGDGFQANGFGKNWGDSEHELEIGKNYLFFVQDSQQKLLDDPFCILEITDDKMVRPIFSVAPERIEEYYIPLQTLKDMM